MLKKVKKKQMDDFLSCLILIMHRIRDRQECFIIAMAYSALKGHGNDFGQFIFRF